MEIVHPSGDYNATLLTVEFAIDGPLVRPKKGWHVVGKVPLAELYEGLR